MAYIVLLATHADQLVGKVGPFSPHSGDLIFAEKGYFFCLKVQIYFHKIKEKGLF
jgi:hypothetical protein